MFNGDNKPEKKNTAWNCQKAEVSEMSKLNGDDSMRINGGYCIHKITEGQNKGKFQIIWSGTVGSGTTVSEELFDFYDEARNNAEFLASISNDAYDWDTCGQQLTVDENGYLEGDDEDTYSICGFTARTSDERKSFKNVFGNQFDM